MTYDEQFLSKSRFSSSYHCNSPMCAARWYETLLERCRPPHACCIWMSDGYLYMCSKGDPRRSATRFIIRSIRSQPLPLADHPKKVIVLASMDKGPHNTSLLKISCHFKSRDDAIEWRIVLQKSKVECEKQRQSEQERLEIFELYLRKQDF
jgi:hypothetical protein